MGMTTLRDIQTRADAGDQDALGVLVAFNVVESALLYGHIPTFGRSDTEILDRVRQYVDAFVADDGPIHGVVDRAPDLLLTARSLRAEGRHDEAFVYFATWIEHWANDLLSIVLRRRQCDETVVLQMLREVSLRSKLTWLPIVLGLPALDQALVGSVLRLSDARNSFIHFKWQFTDMDGRGEAARRETELLASADDIVAQLTEYASTHLKAEPKRLALLFLGLTG
jgi:hypothetical protein